MGNPNFSHKQFAAMSAKRASAKPGVMPAKKTPTLNSDGMHDYLGDVDLVKGHTTPPMPEPREKPPGMLMQARAMKRSY
jgi:hypothetical protein